MSMIYWMVGVSPTQIGALRARPPLARDVATVAESDGEKISLAEETSRTSPEQRAASEACDKVIKEYYAQIRQARERINSIVPIERAVSLEKSWHILHYIFTGHVDAASAPGDFLASGEELGEDVGGYGPARLHGTTEVDQFARFLETLELGQLQQRVNYQEMLHLGIYGLPGGGSETIMQCESEVRDEIAFYFPILQHYVVGRARAQHGLLAWLS